MTTTHKKSWHFRSGKSEIVVKATNVQEARRLLADALESGGEVTKATAKRWARQARLI